MESCRQRNARRDAGPVAPAHSTVAGIPGSSPSRGDVDLLPLFLPVRPGSGTTQLPPPHRIHGHRTDLTTSLRARAHAN